MTDYISREAVRLIESDSEAYAEAWNDSYEQGFCDGINAVLELPAADVVEKEKYDRLLENSLIVSSALQKYQKADVVDAVHGEWEYIGGYGFRHRCSKCVMCVERKTAYCPNCGAKMTGGDFDAAD